MAELTRRDFLRIAGAGAVAAGFGALPLGCAGQEGRELPLLGLFPYTGALAQYGPNMDLGMQVAIEERGGKILGRTIKYIKRDSETSPGPATRRAEEAIDSEGVRFILGPWSSGVALAVSEVAKRRKAIQIFGGGTEDISGKRCHRYSFQWSSHPYNAVNAVVPNFLRLNPNAKRWYLFISDFAFGWSIEKYLKLFAAQNGVQIVGVDRHPLGEREFSSYAAKVVTANPDAVVTATVAQDAVQAVRTLYNFGITPKKPFVMTWAVGDEPADMAPEMRENLYIGLNYWWTLDTPVAKAFVPKYQAKAGKPPDYSAGAAYAWTRLLLNAIEKANSVEPADVVKAMEGWEFEDLIGRSRIDPKNHQNLRPFFFYRAKKKADMKSEYDLLELVGTSNIEPPVEILECKDIGQL